MSTINNNSNNTRSAIYFTYDHFNKKIVGSELNFKKSGNPNNPQYAALMEAMAAHPNYELSAVAPKKEKQTYEGLTLTLMEEYLNLVYEDELADVAREKFAEMKAKKLNKKLAFATIKSWFLELFPKFNVNKARAEVKAKKLDAAKSPYKVIKVSISTPQTSNR